MKVYGALPGGVNGLGAMSVPQLAAVLPTIEGAMTNIHLAERDPQHHHWPNDGAAERGFRLRILLSFHYYKDTDLEALFSKYFTPPYPEVFLDSGGFSAMTQGTTIDLTAYCAFIHRFGHLITTYANLDVIGDAEKTLANQHRMEDKGLQPIPVFHTGEPLSYLETYLTAYPYIALGGMVPYMRNAKRKLMPWLIGCFKLAQGNAVYHGFGCTSWEVVKALPWYSVDSSSWGMGFRYGQVPLFDERAGRFVDVRLGNHAECFAKARLIRALGFDPSDFADRAKNDRAKICAISALSYLKAEQWLRKRHGNIHIPHRQDVPSVLKVHLVDTPPLKDTASAISGLKMHLVTAHARSHTASDLVDANTGLRLYLQQSQAHGDLSDITKVQEGLQ